MIKYIPKNKLVKDTYYYVHYYNSDNSYKNQLVEIRKYAGNGKWYDNDFNNWRAIAEVPEVDLSLYDPEAPIYGSLHCNCCGKNVFKHPGDYFMLKDEVWAKVCDTQYISTEDVLCRKCTEHYLGRKLTPKDYSDAPVNDFLNQTIEFAEN